MAIQIQLRNDTAANWTTANPVLAVGELGLESDTGSYKIGDGTTAWSSLPYGGIDGASAYTIAVQYGFVGDEAAWLASLEGAAGADGVGVPAGGTTGQVLAKVDDTDYNTQWVDGGAGGSADALTVLIYNSGSTAISTGDVVVYDSNSGNGSHYIAFKMPNDGSGNNYQFNDFLGIAIEDIAGDFGEGRVAVAGSISIPVGKISTNGPVYIDSNNGAISPGPSGNPLWNTPIGRSTSNGSDTTTLTIEKSMVTQRLLDIGDVNVDYGNITDGDVLSFNQNTFQFEFRNPSGGGSSVNDNLILNGGFDIWQEINESLSGSNVKTSVAGGPYFADMWKSNQFGGTGTMTLERIVVRNALGPDAVTEYGLETTITADAQGFEFTTHIEDVNTIQDENISISAWVKRSGGGFVVNIIDQNFGAGGSATVNVFGPGATLNANEWTKIQGTVTMPDTYTKNMQQGHHIAVKFNFQGLQPSEVLSIAQVKLERGSSVTDFKPMYPTKAQELLACQRYYYRLKPKPGSYKPIAHGVSVDANVHHFPIEFPTEMYSVPSCNVYGPNQDYYVRSVFENGQLDFLYGNEFTYEPNDNDVGTLVINQAYDYGTTSTFNNQGMILTHTPASNRTSYIEFSSRF